MIELSLKGKNAVVTGGTRGIGKSVSLALATAGAQVYALYARDRKSAEALENEAKEKELRITTIRGDLTNNEKFEESVGEIESACEKIDIIVHAAASGVHRRAMELTDKHMRWTFDINFFAIHKLVQRLHPKMQKGGRVLAITSPGGERVIPHYAAIGASKGALEALFRHYARELGQEGIICNLVCPGMVMTDAVNAFPELEERINSTLESTPTGELTTPEQVGDMVLYLCSDAARNVVGSTIIMDGGKGLLS